MSHDAPHDSARSQRPSLPGCAVGRLGVGADPFAWAGDSSRPPPPRSGQNPATQRLSGRQVRAGHGASLLAGSRAPRFDGYAWQRRHSLTHGLSAWRPAVCCSGRQAVRLPGKQRHHVKSDGASLIDDCRGFGPGSFHAASARGTRTSPTGVSRRGCNGRVGLGSAQTFVLASLDSALGFGPGSFPPRPISAPAAGLPATSAAAGRSGIGAAGAPMWRSRCAEPSPLRHGQPLVEMLAVAERRGRTPTRSHDHGR